MAAGDADTGTQQRSDGWADEVEHLHKVALEEIFQLPLGCRVGKIADVQSATFSGTGKDCILGSRLVSDVYIAQSVGNVVGGVSNFLHGSSHGG